MLPSWSAATRPSVFLYGQLRFAQTLPVMIAMAVLLMLGSVTLTLVAFFIQVAASDRSPGDLARCRAGWVAVTACSRRLTPERSPDRVAGVLVRRRGLA